MKTYVMGDIHGNYKALCQCLERSQFDYTVDRLIVLGDVSDGFPQVRECINELLKIKHLNYIMGNHDEWVLRWATEGYKDMIWLQQGGMNTMISYDHKSMPQAHIDFLKNAHYFLEENGRVFIHAGINLKLSMDRQDKEVLVWDRNLMNEAYIKHQLDPLYRFGPYREIYIGHTPTQVFQSLKPLHMCNVWAMDTGAGWTGKLTIMDVDSKKFWQSDLATDLYKENGRQAKFSKV
ncbi:MAG: metallophosphoesterase [Candidatus Omnitrophica bacterium]|nr:metallophosphoesterase [Candidatus Omnitrophota bacterium]